MARRKLFWYDELLTFHVSSLRPFSLILRALQNGADGMPPSYYGIVWIAKILPVDDHIILRLPSILGYVLTLSGVYLFARKRLQASAGVVAVLLIILSPFRDYALEARSYTLLVGFLAISSVLWQRIDDSAFMKPLFAVFVALAVSVHYYGVVAISAIGIAELSWTLLSRKIRWSVWAALLIGTCPFFLQLPILLHYRSIFGEGFWSKPILRMSVSSYSFYLNVDVKFILVILVLFATLVTVSLSRALRGRDESPRESFSVPELILIGGYLFYPPLLVLATTLGGGGYTERYGWPAILGLVLGMLYVFRTICFRSSTAYLLGALVLVVFNQGRTDIRQLIKPASTVNDRWSTLAELSRGKVGIPIVIGSGLRYLEAAKYAPSEVREKLVEVIDPEIASRLIGADTVDKTNRLLAQFIPLRLEDLAFFEATHPTFILVSGDFGDWFTRYALEKNYRLRLVSSHDAVYMAER
jgi:hypothetical protein